MPQKQLQPEKVPLGRTIGAFLFGLLQSFFRFVFRLIYGVSGDRMPAITDPILLESATSLATKIRNQEVRHLLSYFLPLAINALVLFTAKQRSGSGIVYTSR